MQDCGVQPQLLQIDMPAADYGTPLNLFKKVLEHEKYVTSRIYDMYEVALKEKITRLKVVLNGLSMSR